MNKSGKKDRARRARMWGVYGDRVTDDAELRCGVLDRCWGVRRRW